MSHLLSVVIPCYNEESGIEALLARLDALVSSLSDQLKIEVIIVDDHSTDRTFPLLRQFVRDRNYLKVLRLSRNSGSHIAIIAGMSHCQGEAAVFLAADLQDPPELITELVDQWKKGFDVVWAVRAKREGVSSRSLLFSKLYYWLINKYTDVYFPPSGADFALLDRKVVDGLVQSAGSKPSLGALIMWLGFHQTEIPYVKEARKFGKSKWTLRKKLNAFADAFVGFSYFPMRFMIGLGFFAALAGFLYALVIILLRLTIGHQIQGWSSLMIVVLILGGLQMLMLGVLGEYLWRNLEESRRRPLFLIEATALSEK
jgi:dolichol-phosphate mannosyltransferase